MKPFLLALALLAQSCKAPVSKKALQEPTFGIVIHGGAGTILRANMTPEIETAYRTVLEEAIRAGHTLSLIHI